jgi:hypothetical protein
MSDELLVVLRRCESFLRKPTSLSEPDRLELWRDVSVQIALGERAAAQTVRRCVHIDQGERRDQGHQRRTRHA